ncbi:hypothetical protein P9D51_08255 [Bacillus sonorensis]|uniref:hypothetical protein n=1 Tax=Bacillus TaxID=1386 RepID=UPI001EE66C19|nr:MULTISPECIES: hypothetical protein [Bacillus]MDR4955780.1 hypothetical protein [Bacillus sonorensis]MEC1426116.1 hypothetical protein [Bacillus sonorensis]
MSIVMYAYALLFKTSGMIIKANNMIAAMEKTPAFNGRSESRSKKPARLLAILVSAGNVIS